MHKLGKSEKTIIKFFNRKDAENVLVKKKKFRDTELFTAISNLRLLSQSQILLLMTFKSGVITPQKYEMKGGN